MPHQALTFSATTNKNFLIKTHHFQAQHIRQYSGGTRHDDQDVLYLEAKQYIPLCNSEPGPGDVTVLAMQAIGFPKELYEPFFDSLLESSASRGWKLRSIWIADPSNQGASGILNEQTQGDEPSSYDHARDILHMTNIVRDEFPRPIIGVGHSMGGTTLLHLAAMHPRLLSGMVLYDPIMGFAGREFAAMFYQNSLRTDLWQTREEAEQYFHKLWKKWDASVVELWLKYGLRDTPTLLYPQSGHVTLRSTKPQEGWLYARPAFSMPPGRNDMTPELKAQYRDMNDSVKTLWPFYRPEDGPVWSSLPQVVPNVLYVFPSKGPGTGRKENAKKVERTGSGEGGSGGAKEGKVSWEVLDGVGHLLPFELPQRCADIAAGWIQKYLETSKGCQDPAEQQKDDRSIDKLALSEEWRRQAEVFYLRARSARQAKL